MIAWSERPPLAAHLLNPALIGALAAAAAQAYEANKRSRLPWPLLFVIIPIALHRPTRLSLPRSTATHLSTWVGRHPELMAGFPLRATFLAPYVREGLRFGLRHGILAADPDGLQGLLANVRLQGELGQLVNAAAFCGRWLAQMERASTAFALLGVRP